jgi:hypothetical protein
VVARVGPRQRQVMPRTGRSGVIPNKEGADTHIAELKKLKNCKASICSPMKSLQTHARAHLIGGDAGGLKRAIANDGAV